MSIAVDLLKAEHIGIRDLKAHMSTKLLNNLMVITDKGKPVSVNLPYQDLLELMDILDELTDPGTMAAINNGREAIRSGEEGIPVSNLR